MSAEKTPYALAARPATSAARVVVVNVPCRGPAIARSADRAGPVLVRFHLFVLRNSQPVFAGQHSDPRLLRVVVLSSALFALSSESVARRLAVPERAHVLPFETCLAFFVAVLVSLAQCMLGAVQLPKFVALDPLLVVSAAVPLRYDWPAAPVECAFPNRPVARFGERFAPHEL